MAKNTAETEAEQWVSGPVDWGDVPTVKAALEAWSAGGRVDFEVSEDLFYKLLECAGTEDDFFMFRDGQVRFKGWDARSHEDRQQLAAERAAGDLDFPITLNRAARWYCFANVYTACSMPEYVPKVLAAKDYATARNILHDAHRKAKADVDEKAATLLSASGRRVAARHTATRDRDEARKRERAVQGCLDAIDAATGSPGNLAKRQPMPAKERGKLGGSLSNAANRDTRQKIIDDYQSGDTASKNAAAAELAMKYGRAESTVRGVLKGVKWKGVSSS